ncbi:hypothetical protein PVAG01_01674 [Phlyctema vagabunda]|uniref:Mitochondrial inner membrane protein 1 n=1 Tax=Phlyctema vagabunda TaxID=108571 RepID=A0ABR4PY86_9HELO
MLRTTAARSLRNALTKLPTSRSSYSAAASQINNVLQRKQLNNRRPQVLAAFPRPTTTSMLYATKSEPPYDRIDPDAEKKTLDKEIKPHPELVSGGSSVRHVFEHGQGEKEESEMLDGMKADIKTIKETFELNEVPRDALYLGAAGILPYAATSVSTVWLSYEINHGAANHGQGVVVSPETAHQMLEFITPVQIGYGAVIISFLGAIHWGLEYAGYGGRHSYRRYVYGVIAPAVAWPTLLMPAEYALITQFAAFNFLYFADARATVKGWFPAWYSTYRFVLTFFVGASIVISLIGRGQIVQQDHAAMKSPVDYLKGDRDAQWMALEREEKERRQTLAKKEEEEETDDEAEDTDDEGGDDQEDDSKSDDKGDDKKDDKKKEEKK